MDNEIGNTHLQDFESTKPVALEININSKGYLLEITKWAKLFAVLGFVLTGLILTAMLFMNSITRQFNEFVAMAPTIEGNENPLSAFGNGFSAIFTVIYLAMAVLYFFPSFYLFQFSTKMKSGLLQDDSFHVEDGLKNLKSVFKFWGITTVLLLSFYTFFFVIGILTALFL